jgi:hypothetical protein
MLTTRYRVNIFDRLVHGDADVEVAAHPDPNPDPILDLHQQQQLQRTVLGSDVGMVLMGDTMGSGAPMASPGIGQIGLSPRILGSNAALSSMSLGGTTL